MNQDRKAESPADNDATEADPAEVLAYSLQTAVAAVARLGRRFRKRASDDFDELEHALMMACGALTKLIEAHDDQATNIADLQAVIRKLARRFTAHRAETMGSDPKTDNNSGGKDEQKSTNANTATGDSGKKKRKPRTGQKYNK